MPIASKRHQRQVGPAAARLRRQQRADGDADREDGKAGRSPRLRCRRGCSFTSGGSSDRATKPTSQNQDTMCAPLHRRLSVRASRSSASVEVQGLAVMARSGAAGPDTGMACANSHDARASSPMTANHELGALGLGHGDAAGDGADEDRQEGCAFHQRVAGGELGGLEFLGQQAIFQRPEQRGDDAEQAESDEQDRHRLPEEPDAASPATGISASLMQRATMCLVVAVGKLAAERRQDEERRNEDDARERDQQRRAARLPPLPTRRARTGSAWPAHS